MKKRRFKSLFFFGVLEYRCGLSKSIKSLGDPIENTCINQELNKNTLNGSDSYQNNDPRHDHYMYNTKYSRNSSKNHGNKRLSTYLHYKIRIETPFFTGSENNHATYIEKFSDICGKNSNERQSFSTKTNTDGSDLTIRESYNDLDVTQKYRHLWIQCENCNGLNFNKFSKSKSKINICEHCGRHFNMSSSNRIELLIDPNTWEPVAENIVSLDPSEFNSEEVPYNYKDHIYYFQRKTGLTEVVQTGIGKLNGVSAVALGVMDFNFMGGSLGSTVGEKIRCLIESATHQFVPLILVCSSGGARIQEGSFSLIQMAKIASALYDYQSNKKVLYVAILTSPTTGGVTASFGMLGDILIAEPASYIAFAGKRVIEETLNKSVSEGSQLAEILFQKGLLDPIVPRNLLKVVLSELFHIQALYLFCLNENSSRNV
uniref:acetyl-CoA carboxylase carboxyltransferase beta subunit n=1 Tax=Urtica urens TaxID=473050 RepID=UPI002114513A|nr:acetyl-CoA carboxylase carboxyltransferase beta subunit [Urtica urens]USG56081.1 acetyl-CoA carboxylase carboxyltransferase beta subunit [Urtica sp.]USG56246.1 acetyl-CoA carboxylase carboxyltransferase beta subunit [Urtica urens]USG56330.1 acetyl-CoA carboxylase carboxyltransferase beta subunit [Urtica urens]